MCIHSEYDQTLAVGRGMCPFCQDETIAELRAAQAQIRGFAKVMDENNWRDLKLHIERQCAVEQSSPIQERKDV